MSRQSSTILILLLVFLTAFPGCHATQPFYFHENGDLSQYLDQALTIDEPDLEQPHLEEVDGALSPLTLRNSEFKEFWDLQLEEVVAIALQNSKVIRNSGAVTRFGGPADSLVGRTGTATIYDPAIFESDPQRGVEAALSAFDAQFATQVFWQKQDRPQNTSFNFISSQQDLGQFEASITKRTAPGTQFTIRNQTTYDKNDRGFRFLPSDWFTAFEVEATHPLMRGRGTQVNRIPIMLARINSDITLLAFESNIRDLVMNVETAYWDLYCSYRNLETNRAGHDSALASWKSEEAKLASGASTVQQKSQAEEQYFFFKSQLQSALAGSNLSGQSGIFQAERRLRWLMGLAPTDGRTIRPIDEPTSAWVEFDWSEIQTEALVRSTELRSQKWNIKAREQELILARNQLLPQFNVIGLYRWLGMGDDLIEGDRNGINFPASGSLAFDELTEGNYQEVRVGLEYTPTAFGARRELAGVQNARIRLVRDKAVLEDMELNVSHVLSDSLNLLVSHYELAETNLQRWAAAEKDVESAQALFDGGRGVLDQVLDAQQRRAQAQIDYYRSLCEYNKSIADVHYRKGSLLEYSGIQLAEGPWPKKAYWDALGHARRRDASTYLNYGWSRPKVISRGEYSQQYQQPLADVFGDELAPGQETIPTPMPTPADPSQEARPLKAASVEMLDALGGKTSKVEAAVFESVLEEAKIVKEKSTDWSGLGLVVPKKGARSKKSSVAQVIHYEARLAPSHEIQTRSKDHQADRPASSWKRAKR